MRAQVAGGVVCLPGSQIAVANAVAAVDGTVTIIAALLLIQLTQQSVGLRSRTVGQACARPRVQTTHGSLSLPLTVAAAASCAVLKGA